MCKSSKKCVFLNYDDTHFAHSRTQAGIDPGEDEIRALVRKYCGTDVTDILFCIGGRIAAIPNTVMDDWCVKYHQTRENGRDVCYTNHYTRMYRELIETKKLDTFALWIDEARKVGIRPWLSFRVNDCHCNSDPTSILHPEFFHQHPEYRRIRHREPLGYFDRCFDFSFDAVRDRELAYIREVLVKYDPYGIEIDWMREPYCFPPGREECAVLTDFMRNVRNLTDAASKQRGHPVSVLARVPSDAVTALHYGFDVAMWADEGLVDILAPSPRWATADNNIEVDVWKRLLRGTKVLLAPGLELRILGQQGRGFQMTTGLVVGAAAAFYSAGADGLYLYNFFDDPAWQDPEKRYWKGKGGTYSLPFSQQQETLAVAWPNQEKWLRMIGDMEKVIAAPRQHMLSYRDVAVLEKSGDEVPFPTKIWKNCPRFFRLETGPVPAGRKMFVRLGVPDGKPPKRVFVNSRLCTYVNNEECVPAFTASPLCVYEVSGYAERTAIIEVICEEQEQTIDHLDVVIQSQ